MKSLSLFVVTCFFSLSSLANSPLKDSMKVVGDSFKQIALAFQNQQLTEVDLEAAKKLQRALADASLQYPGTANTDELKLQYMNLMAQVSQKSLVLEDAIEKQLLANPQDLSEVMVLFRDMNLIRKESHEIFKIEE